MRKVVFVEPDTREWKQWRAKAQKEIEKQRYVPGGEVKIKTNLYKERRDDIVRLFNGKCAYCEQKILYVTRAGEVEQLDQAGDVEHFRPKGRLTDQNHKSVRYKIDGQEYDHPGYYWLAYDPMNLLLACAACNRPWTNALNRLYGKWDMFPITDERNRANCPADLSGRAPDQQEKPLLINPLDPNYKPEKHFSFKPKTGELIAKTVEAQTCIDLLGLNRDGLLDARKTLYLHIEMLLAKINQGIRYGDGSEALEHIHKLNEHKAGKEAFTFTAQASLNKEDSILEKLRDLTRTDNT